MEYIRNKGFALVEGLEGDARRTCTVSEAQERMGVSRKNALAILGHLKKQKRIVALTKGLYALWHPSERRQGLHPLPILDALMRFRKTAYYVGLLSAADHYGAAHHKPQVLQVMIPKQLHFRKAKDLRISFHVHKGFPLEGIVRVKHPSGAIAFSSPELTALDILYFEAASGGFGNVCQVIHDLIAQLVPKKLKEAIRFYPHAAPIQRLGYLMDYFKVGRSLIGPVRQWVRKHSPAPVALSSGHLKKGPLHKKWGIIRNAPVETES